MPRKKSTGKPVLKLDGFLGTPEIETAEDNERIDLFSSMFKNFGDVQSGKTDFVKELRSLRTDEELLDFVKKHFGIHIPYEPVCEDHQSPGQAFCDAFFGRARNALWWASRASFKSFGTGLLTVLDTMRYDQCETTILAGSEQQGRQVYSAAQAHIYNAHLERMFKLRAQTSTSINGSQFTILTASPKSVRGPHPQRLKLDEVDEIPEDIYAAAVNQPMEKHGVPMQMLMTSTMHRVGGLMSELVDNSPTTGLKVYKWCIGGDARITLEDLTTKALKEVQVGDRVRDQNGNVQTVIETHKRRLPANEPALSIKVQGIQDPIIATYNHRFDTRAKQETFAGNLVVGDELIQPLPVLPKVGNKTYNEGRVVGMYLADGYREKKGYSVSFSCDSQHEANELITVLNELFPPHIEPLRQGVRGNGAHIRKQPVENMHVVGIASTRLCQLLDETVLKFGGRGKKKLTLDGLAGGRAFLMGVYDGFMIGDGHTKTNGLRVAQIGCRELAEQMFQIGTKLGYNLSFSSGVNRPGPRGRINGTVGNQFFRIDELMSARSMYRRIQKIEIVQPKYVYNVTVTGTHTIQTNFIATHQCYKEVTQKCNEPDCRNLIHSELYRGQPCPLLGQKIDRIQDIPEEDRARIKPAKDYVVLHPYTRDDDGNILAPDSGFYDGSCQGDLRRASGYIKVDAQREARLRVQKKTWEVENESRRPSQEDMVYDPMLIKRGTLQGLDWDWRLPTERSWAMIDWGFNNPTVMLLAQDRVLPGKELKHGPYHHCIVEEYYWEQRGLAWRINEICTIVQEKNIRQIYADAENIDALMALREALAGRNYECLVRGVPFNKFKDILIENIRNDMEFGHWFISEDNCSQTIRDLYKLHYRRNTEDVAKEADHGPDAMVAGWRRFIRLNEYGLTTGNDLGAVSQVRQLTNPGRGAPPVTAISPSQKPLALPAGSPVGATQSRHKRTRRNYVG